MINPSLQGQKDGQDGHHGSPGGAGGLSGGGCSLNPPSPCTQGWLLPPPAMAKQPLRHCPGSWKKGKNNPAEGNRADLGNAGPCFIAQTGEEAGREVVGREEEKADGLRTASRGADRSQGHFPKL